MAIEGRWRVATQLNRDAYTYGPWTSYDQARQQVAIAVKRWEKHGLVIEQHADGTRVTGRFPLDPAPIIAAEVVYDD